MWHIYADKNDNDMAGNIPMTYYTAEKKKLRKGRKREWGGWGVVEGTKKGILINRINKMV